MKFFKFSRNSRGCVEGPALVVIIVLVVLVIAGGVWAGIHFLTKPKYEASTRFAYSVDDGMTYREGIQVIKVGQRYYLSVDMKVAVSKMARAENVKATLTLPNVNIVDATLFDNNGSTKLTGDVDSINHTATYTFTIVPSTDPLKFSAVFEFVPNSEGVYTITLSYDEKLDSAYDKTETVRFVAE